MKRLPRGFRPASRTSLTARALVLSSAAASLALAGCAAVPAPSPASGNVRAPGTAALAATTGTGVWSDDFSLAAVPGLFGPRSLAVSVTAAGHGETAIRVDALVDWIPVRPAGDTVPATVRVATLTETARKFTVPGGQPVTVIHQLTVTGLAKVAALARYLNGLPVNPPGGATSCLMPSGGLTVTFRARAGGPVLARATATVGGCDTLTYAMPGHPDITVGGGPGGDNLLTELNRVTGLHWKTPQG